MTNQDHKMIKEALDDQAKTQHSKNSIFFFFVFGITLFLVKKQPLFSFRAFAFFLFGMFFASFLSVPSYLIKSFISKRIKEHQAIILSKFYWLFELVYDFFITFILFSVYVRLIG